MYLAMMHPRFIFSILQILPPPPLFSPWTFFTKRGGICPWRPRGSPRAFTCQLLVPSPWPLGQPSIVGSVHLFGSAAPVLLVGDRIGAFVLVDPVGLLAQRTALPSLLQVSCSVGTIDVPNKSGLFLVFNHSVCFAHCNLGCEETNCTKEMEICGRRIYLNTASRLVLQRNRISIVSWRLTFLNRLDLNYGDKGSKDITFVLAYI